MTLCLEKSALPARAAAAQREHVWLRIKVSSQHAAHGTSDPGRRSLENSREICFVIELGLNVGFSHCLSGCAKQRTKRRQNYRLEKTQLPMATCLPPQGQETKDIRRDETILALSDPGSKAAR